MEVIAKGRYIRMSPSKTGLLVELIRGKKAQEAVNILRFSDRRAAQAVLKVLNSAIANAKNNFDLSEEKLVISKAIAESGPTLKRGRFVSRGRRHPILKRMTHITVGLKETKIEESSKRPLGSLKIKRKKSKKEKEEK